MLVVYHAINIWRDLSLRIMTTFISALKAVLDSLWRGSVLHPSPLGVSEWFTDNYLETVVKFIGYMDMFNCIKVLHRRTDCKPRVLYFGTWGRRNALKY